MSTQRHLHFVQSVEPLQGGGLGRAALELHDAFLAGGTPSHLVATHGGAPQAAGRAHVEEFRRGFPAPLYLAPELRRRARGLVEATDVLHAHGFYVGTNWILGREARRLGRALVCHAHGFFEPWILARSRGRKRLVHLLFEDANFRAARLWRALTAREADQIRAQGITAPIVVAANGIDLPALDSPAGAPTRPDLAVKARRRALFLARIHPKKGLDLLIPAWARSATARSAWELVIAGPDELGHRAQIEALVRQHGLEATVRFVGTVTGADKAALLKSADLFVLPSYSEGFSVAILEAMACRVPVLATHACNFPELAVEGGGWLCESAADPVAEALARAVDATDDERRDRGAAARALVERRYTWPSISRTLLDACATLT